MMMVVIAGMIAVAAVVTLALTVPKSCRWQQQHHQSRDERCYGASDDLSCRDGGVMVSVLVHWQQYLLASWRQIFGGPPSSPLARDRGDRRRRTAVGWAAAAEAITPEDTAMSEDPLSSVGSAASSAYLPTVRGDAGARSCVPG